MELVQAARAKAARCDFAGALDGMEQALVAGQKEWKPGAAGFLVIHQDMATYANRTFDYRRAEASARAALASAIAKSGPDGPEQAVVSQNLAVALGGMGRRAEAAAIFDRILPQLTAADPTTGTNAELAFSQFEYNVGRPTSGLDHAERAAELSRSGNVAAGLRASVLMHLADARRRALQFDRATQAADEASVALKEAGGNAESSRLALVRAGIAYERGRLARSLEIVEGVEHSKPPFDPCDPTLMVDLIERRATLHMIRRELPEAAAAFTSALAALARLKLGPNAREGEITYGLAVIAGMSRKFDRSTALFDAAVAAFREVYGPASEAEAQALLEKAYMLGEAGRARDGVDAAKAAIAVIRGTTEHSPLALAYAQASLGLVSFKAGDFPTAREALGLALDEFRDARGAASFDLTPGLGALGEMALAERDPVRAESFFRRALAIQRRWGGDSALSLGVTLSNLAAARSAQGARVDALDQSSAAVDILRKRMAIGEARPWNDAQAERIAARSIVARDMALVTAETRPGHTVASGKAVERLLVAGQLANAASTGGAIAQMMTRLQAASPALGALLGERNDLSAEWRAVQDDLVASLAQPDEGDDLRREALLRRQQEISARLEVIDRQLMTKDPRLDLLIKSRAVGLAELQEALRPGEAMLAFTVAEDASYTVLVRKDSSVAFRSALNRAQIEQIVGRLRAALDPARWTSELPPFDTDGAYRLFAELIAPANNYLADTETLLIVPDGALASIPFTLLLTAPVSPIAGEPEDYKNLPWLVRRFAVVNYPSVASVVALRAMQASSVGRTTLFGVGDAVFAGDQGDGAVRGALLRGLAQARLADVSLLRQLTPLPETRDELNKMADALGRANARLLLGRDANERLVRNTPLESYNILVFATHGLVAGDLTGYAEPALALTPPPIATPADDGLLSASEIATMHIHADWVILSACNTAAGDGTPHAEPLSGLAKSFFYAGARSLLVTHWPVDSEAATKLTTTTVKGTMSGASPAAALRAAELDFIENRDGALRTHPFFWAPFNVIGDR